MPRSIDLDMECWFCGAPISREEVERDALLVPRQRDQGGPFYLHRCPGCTRQSRVERNRAGSLLVSPPPIVPLVDSILATFDADLRAELERKREHQRRRSGRREWFFGAYADELWAEGHRPHRARTGAAPRADAPPPERRARREPERGREPGPGPERAAPPQPESAPEPTPEPAPEPAAAPPLAREPTPWEVLGLEEGAPEEEVQRAFRELAKRYHPDRFEALDEDFRALAEAKFVRLKAAYDELLERLRR
ncbi:MAG: DnaJ domain-containing protein [Planctomycetota bacterium]